MLEDALSNCWEESYPTLHIDYILIVTIFIESRLNQNYDEHPVWQNILDIERCEREKDDFVTIFPFHSFFIWHYSYKNLFFRTDRNIYYKGI